MLIQKFRIDTDKVKQRNEELMKLNWVDKLTTEQKKFLNWRKGPPKIMNRDGLFSYYDLSNYLINQDKFNEVNVNNLREYLTVYDVKQKWNSIQFDNINDDLKKILTDIQDKRIKAIQKYIRIEDSIFKKGIYSNDLIYRMQEKPIEGNIIKNATPWSLAPIEWFCGTEECHLYITKIPSNIKVIYIENKSKDKNLVTFDWFSIYEFEYILPRDIEFKEIRTKKIKIPNKFYNEKDEEKSKFKEQKIFCHWIKITRKVKSKEFPKINNIKLVVPYNTKKQIGGKNKEFYQQIIKNNKQMKKADLLGYILSIIMKENKINSDSYMIIASYCLKEYREVTDLDVIVTPNTYNILKEYIMLNNIGTVSVAKISGDERLVIQFKELGNDVEIEIFSKEEDLGFPSDTFSLKNLRDNNLLDKDQFGNPYYNLKICIEQYSSVTKKDNEYYIGNFRITKERVEKNINHLKNILNIYKQNNNDTKNMIEQKIEYLMNLIN